jgi:mono/diheme cytochrome c family protein
MRFALRLALLGCMISLLLVTPARAQFAAGDSLKGRELAQRLCATCHVVGSGEAGTAVPGVPTFAAIANHKGQTPERLAGLIIIPHPPMPAVQLTMPEIRDVIAYIRSLERR